MGIIFQVTAIGQTNAYESASKAECKIVVSFYG